MSKSTPSIPEGDAEAGPGPEQNGVLSPPVEAIPVDETLDAKGLNCPLPILRTKLALSKMAGGQVLHVTATDPHSVIDFKAFCLRTKHELLRLEEGDGLFEFYIRRHH